MRLAESRHALRWLIIEAFCEGIFFPIPCDLMLMPMVLAKRNRAWFYALVTTLASIAGGSVGYALGYFLEPFGQQILTLTGSPNGLEKFQQIYDEIGLVILVLPLPFKILAIASGLARFNFTTFLIAAFLLRGARFFLVAALLRVYGEPVKRFVEKQLALVFSGLALVLIGLLFFIKILLH